MATGGDIYRANIYTTFSSQTALVTSHWYVSATAGTGATDAQIADAMNNAWHAAFKALIASAASYRGVSVQKIVPAPVAVLVYSTLNQGVGTVIGDALPRQVAGLIGLRTALAGRAYRGRNYIPFPGEADNDAGNFATAGYVTRLTTLATAMTANVAAGGGGNTNTLKRIIFHSSSNTGTDVTQATVTGNWATQRRRGSFGRANNSPI